MTIQTLRCARFFAGLLALAAALLPACAFGASVDRLMEASGMRHALEQVPATIVQSMDAPQPGVEIPVEIRVASKDAATQAFRVDQLVASVRTRLAKDLSERVVQDALQWLDTALGKRITELEIKASDPAVAQQLEAYARELQRRPPPQSRRKLVRELNLASHSTESVAAIMEAMALAAALGVNAAQPRTAQMPGELLRQKVKEALPQLNAQADALVTTSLLHTYRTLPDRDLAEYLRFLQTPSGAAYSRAGATAIRDALTEAIGRFMVALPKALERSRGSGRT